jgi:hypothetical protein
MEVNLWLTKLNDKAIAQPIYRGSWTRNQIFNLDLNLNLCLDVTDGVAYSMYNPNLVSAYKKIQ